MDKLSKLSVSYIERDVSIRQMEMGYLKQVLLLCFNLLKFVISIKLAAKPGKRPKLLSEETIKSVGKRHRKYLSLFGLIEFSRPGFCSDQRGMLYILDADLDFPQALWSYNLQELAGENATEVDYRESVRTINALLGLGLSGPGSERNINRLGRSVSEYYEAKEVEVQQEAVCFSASFDGKGVPKIKPRDKHKARGMKRLGRGEKLGIKQMATVGAMSWFEPKERSVAPIIRGLMGSPLSNKGADRAMGKAQQNDNRWHQEFTAALF